MFDINGFEFAFIALLGVLLIGPERLPEYAAKLREWARSARDAFMGARDSVAAEVGDDVDWSQYDPRQYDPRRIVREAFAEEPGRGAAASAPGAVPAAATTGAAATAAATAHAGSVASAGGARLARAASSLPDGQAAPFDADAT